MNSTAILREQLTNLLRSEQAHASFDQAIAKLPSKLRGAVPRGLPYSPWQLLEHIRLAQRDILDYCRNKDYAPMNWPDDYWPKSPKPPSAAAWNKSVAAYRADRDAMIRLVADPKVDLFASVPSSKKHTLLREVLLLADHTAYHLGQFMHVRRLLSGKS